MAIFSIPLRRSAFYVKKSAGGGLVTGLLWASVVATLALIVVYPTVKLFAFSFTSKTGLSFGNYVSGSAGQDISRPCSILFSMPGQQQRLRHCSLYLLPWASPESRCPARRSFGQDYSQLSSRRRISVPLPGFVGRSQCRLDQRCLDVSEWIRKGPVQYAILSVAWFSLARFTQYPTSLFTSATG